MDELRKRAYRVLLYQAMLDLRIHSPTSPYTPARWWNPWFWRRVRERLTFAMLLADWLHNLAFFSAADFEHFDEAKFWGEYDRLRPRFARHGTRYREAFERELVQEGWFRPAILTGVPSDLIDKFPQIC